MIFKVWVSICTFMVVAVSFSSAMYFELPANTEKCLREEIHKDVLVKGDFDITQIDKVKTDLKITDSNGHILYQKEDATSGKFAFTTDDYDMFQLCFNSKTEDKRVKPPPQDVRLELKRGIDAKNYDELAKNEQLKPLEIELRRLEDLSKSITDAFSYMKKREEEMRDTNESTNSRVLYFSAFSMLCLVGLATWQVLYLRKFFKSKKLIE